jgi:hypothetical protein
MQKKITSILVQNNKGFSLLEVLLGITVFMIGMLGVTALNISSLKSNTFSGNISEAVVIAGDKLEELMAFGFDGKDIDGDGNLDVNEDVNCNGILDVGEDTDGDGNLDVEEDPLDDIDGDGTNQDPGDIGSDTVGSDDKFGLNDTGANADYMEPPGANNPPTDPGCGRNNMYYVYWNVADGEPLPEKTKTVNVIVEWYIKDVKRSINMSTIILDAN